MKDKTGKTLETIVADLERTLANNKNIVVTRNAKLIDRDGFEREIDVLIEIISDTKKQKFAFEIKDYGVKSAVKLEHIDAFYAKIESHEIKGIFLTSGRFQKNAIEKAKKKQIDLYVIEDSTQPLIKKALFFSKRHEIVRVQLISKHFEAFPNFDPKEVFMGEPKRKWKFKSYMEDYIKPQMKEAISSNISLCFEDFMKQETNSLTWGLDKKKRKQLIGFLDLVYFKYNKEYYPITHFICDIDFWIESLEHDNPETKQYKSLSEKKSFANFFSEIIKINSGEPALLNIINPVGSSDLKFNLITGKGKNKQTTELISYGNINVELKKKQ